MHDRSELQGFLRGNEWGVIRGELLALTRCHSSGLPQLYKDLGWKCVYGRDYNLKGIKGKISVFLLFLKLFSLLP